MAQRKGQSELKLRQIVNDLRGLQRLGTVRDFCGQVAPMPSGLEIFSFDPILRQTCEEMRRQWRISAPALPDAAHESCLLSRSRLG